MQSSKGNCITEEVTEMPRCCSRRIQSEVAWRGALRPLAGPAIWMAPPNSSSFSVKVVLPASGWEMMAKVRLFLISPANGPLDMWDLFHLRQQDSPQHGGILTARRRLIVSTPHHHLLEPPRA